MPSRAVDWRYASRSWLGFFVGMVVERIRKENVLIALFIDRVGVCDGQETCIDVERNILLDEGSFSVVDIDDRFSRIVNTAYISLFGDLRR